MTKYLRRLHLRPDLDADHRLRHAKLRLRPGLLHRRRDLHRRHGAAVLRQGRAESRKARVMFDGPLDETELSPRRFMLCQIVRENWLSAWRQISLR